MERQHPKVLRPAATMQFILLLQCPTKKLSKCCRCHVIKQKEFGKILDKIKTLLFFIRPIIGLVQSIIDSRRERRQEELENQQIAREKQKKDEMRRAADNEKARAASAIASLKAKMAYENQRELNHRP